MEQFWYNEIIPPLIFFIIFSIAFSLLELIVIFLLNRVEQKNWGFMIDVIIRAKVHHGKAIHYIVLVALSALVLSFLFFTPLIQVLTFSSKELKIFAVLLALVMFLIYGINLRKSTRLNIEKKIYGTIFLVISIVFYVFILVLANESYQGYVQFMNRQFISPTVKKVETVIEEKEEDRLLKKFRQQYAEGLCEEADYTEEQARRLEIKNFLLIASDPELAFGETALNIADPKANLKGKVCRDEENTFLLTEQGDWYWITEEHLIYGD